MVWSSINTGGVILTPQFLLCMINFDEVGFVMSVALEKVMFL